VTTSDFLDLYDAKVAEYLIAVIYLVLFSQMWGFATGSPEPKPVKEVKRAMAALQHYFAH